MTRWETMFRATVHFAGYAMMWIFALALSLMLFAALVDGFYEAGWLSANLLGLSDKSGTYFTIAYIAIALWLAFKVRQKTKSTEALR